MSTHGSSKPNDLPVVKPEEIGFSSERLARIGIRMQERVDRKEIPGAVTLIARHGEIAHLEAHGYMDVESKKPMTTDAIFRIASTTKIFTSVALLMLYEEGIFNLDDPISKYLPEFKNPMVIARLNTGGPPPRSMISGVPVVPAWREINFRDCITHTAGFAGRSTPVALLKLYLDAFRNTPYAGLILPPEMAGEVATTTVREFVKRLARIPLSFQPGTDWEYGAGHDVAGTLVEVISGTTLADFMQKRIFEPLRITDTFFYTPEDKLPRLVSIYGSIESEDGWQIVVGARNKGGRGFNTYFGGGGGLFSTIPDLARFAQMLLDNGTLNGIRILSRKTIELMTTNHTGNFYIPIFGPGYGYGLGVSVCLNPAGSRIPASPGTFGWGGAFATFFYVDPKEDIFGLYSTQVLGAGAGMRLPTYLGSEFQRLGYQALID